MNLFLTFFLLLYQLAFGLRNRQITLQHGKILGGSMTDTVNVYLRGNAHDYDNWAENLGAGPGWSAQAVLPYFLRTENNTDPAVVAAAPAYVHSTSGPLKVSTVPNPDPITTKWLNAVVGMGWPKTDFADFYHQYGVSLPQTTQSPNNWTRETTATVFIEPVLGTRTNLHLLLNAHVTRILFNNSPNSGSPMMTTGLRATGVEFSRPDGTLTTVRARKEVILSAGSLNSPQILMLSGVGPRDHLNSLGIPVLADLPVGSTLYDHPKIPLDFTVNNASDITLTGDVFGAMNVQNLYQFYLYATGPLSRKAYTYTYFGTGVNGDQEWPDAISYQLISQVYPDMDVQVSGYDQSRADQWRTYFNQWADASNHIYLSMLLFRTLSSGSVRLASRNPYDAPLIDPAVFSVRQDLDATVRAMSILFQQTETPIGRQLYSYSRLPVPGCTFCTDGRPISACLSYLTCVAQQVTLVDYHEVGSNRMGNASSPDAVVDERLRVRGIGSLRIIDASVMPAIPTTPMNTPTMMVAEKGVHMLQQDWGLAGPNLN